MGLRSDIQTDIAAAFNGDLADAVQPFTLVQSVTTSYNPTTGEYTKQTVSYASRGVFEDSTTGVLDENKRYTATTLTILQNELAATPVVDDLVVTTSREYRVTAVTPDPAAASWVLGIEDQADGS